MLNLVTLNHSTQKCNSMQYLIRNTLISELLSELLMSGQLLRVALHGKTYDCVK